MLHSIREGSWVGCESTSHFSMPPHLAPGIAGEPRDIGVPRLDDPRLEPGARDNPTSMGEPGGRPSNNQSSCLVKGLFVRKCAEGSRCLRKTLCVCVCVWGNVLASGERGFQE